VAVLIDLVRNPLAGGHVKAWERFAEAATSFGEDLDLTVYYLAEEETEVSLAENVRIRTVPPAFGTSRIPFLRNGAGDTDLAGYNPSLARYLPDRDVLHATSSFAFAKTAQLIAQRHSQPLVSSIHTDVAKFAEVYTGEVLEKLVGHGVLSRWLVDAIHVPEISARNLARTRDRILRASDRILVSNEHDQRHVLDFMPPSKVSLLRRGVDKILFSPAKRDRAWLERTYGVPVDMPVALFAGRVDESKRVLTVARAARLLTERGHRLHVVVAGEGSAMGQLEAILEKHLTLTGSVSQEELARLMASADLFVFPSESETVGNVVIEAKASGLPVVLTAGATTARLLSSPGVDGLLAPDRSPEAYAATMAPLVDDPELRRRIGRNARHGIETSWPDWSDVVAEDLLPVWRAAYDEISAEDRQPPRAA
jgi:glycosyltransferase involved in cell wall biosynthesis